jgi:hypothetical protein
VKETADGGNYLFRSFALSLKLTKINTLRWGKELQGILVKIVIVCEFVKGRSLLYSLPFPTSNSDFDGHCLAI